MKVKGSFWAEMTLLKVLFFWLIIPVIIAVVVAKSYSVSISDKTIEIETGVLNKKNSKYAIAGITETTVNQPFFGRIFNYGDVCISLAGDKQVYLKNIVSPNDVKTFIDEKLLKTADSSHIFVN